MSYSGPPCCLPCTSAPPAVDARNAASAGLRCLLPGCMVRHYLPRRRRAQPPVAQRRYTETSWPRARQSPDAIRPTPRHPSPTSMLTFARPTSPAALSVGGPSRTVLEQCFRLNPPSLSARRERCRDDGDTERCDRDCRAEPSGIDADELVRHRRSPSRPAGWLCCFACVAEHSS